MRALAALLLALQLAAHTVAVLDGELTVSADGGCALVLAIPADAATWLGGPPPRTRAEAAAWLERARPRLAAGVTLAVAGVPHAAGRRWPPRWPAGRRPGLDAAAGIHPRALDIAVHRLDPHGDLPHAHAHRRWRQPDAPAAVR
jgi:hypothetical protein